MLTVTALALAVHVALGSMVGVSGLIGSPTDPGTLESFRPGDSIPGVWTLEAVSDVTRSWSPKAVRCPGRGWIWRRPDGTRLQLDWVRCRSADLPALANALDLTRTDLARQWQRLSTLPGGADLVVQRNPSSMARTWIQGEYWINLTARCLPTVSASECATLTGATAPDVAARVPGAPRAPNPRPPDPVMAKATPNAATLISGVLMAWLLLVRAGRWGQRLDGFDPGSDPRLVHVDMGARVIRGLARGRRVGHVLLTAGIVVGVGAVDAWSMPGSAIALTVAALLCRSGASALRRSRHPMLGMGWLLRQRRRPPRLTPARVLSLAVTGLQMLYLVAAAALIVVVTALFTLSGSDAGFTFGGLLVAALGGGWFLDRLAARLRSRDAEEVLRADPRPPFVFLRNFGDDDAKLPASPLTRQGPWQAAAGPMVPISTARFDEVLARALTAAAPVIALDHPAHRLRSLGAAKLRITSPDEQAWKHKVREWSGTAEAVVLLATPSEVGHGLRWELGEFGNRSPHGRVILVFGPGHRSELHRRYALFLQEVDHYPLFAMLSDNWVTDGALILVHTPSVGWGTWQGWSARSRDAWTYCAAVERAVGHAREVWSLPAAAMDLAVVYPTVPAVRSAVERAVTATEGCPVDTAHLLVALATVDGDGRWDRVRLRVRLDAAAGRYGSADPDPRPRYRFGSAEITGSCGRAFIEAARLSRRHRLPEIPAGVLAQTLIRDPASAAATSLGLETSDRQQDVIRLIDVELLDGLLHRPGEAIPGA